VKNGIVVASVGVGVGLAVTAFDLARWNRHLLSVVGDYIVHVVILLVLAIAVALILVRVARRTRLLARVDMLRPNVAIVAGIIVALIGFAAWAVRPNLQKSRGSPNDLVGFVQRLNHVTFDPTRRYVELTMRWVSWYVGPLTLAIGIVGAALLTVVLVRGGARFAAQVAALMLGPAVVISLWRPATLPDQVWAARRFLPAVIPAIILLTFGALYVFALGTGSTFASQRRSIAIVIAAVVIGYPFVTVDNVSRMTEQRGLFSVITRTCETLPSDSAVVMVPEIGSNAYLSTPQTLRGFCDVPVVVMKNPVDVDEVRLLAQEWRDEGRQLWVVSQYPQTIRTIFPRARVHSTPRQLNLHFLEQTLTRRPSRYRPESFQLSAAEVPSPATAPAPAQ